MAFTDTFSMIKPDAYAKGYTTAMLEGISGAGFRLRALKLTHLSWDEASRFYQEHRSRPFYKDLCDYISSGPLLAIILSYEGDAVEAFRELIGHTDPKKASAKTLRARFGTSIESNAVHGADGKQSAEREAAFFFSDRERFSPTPI